MELATQQLLRGQTHTAQNGNFSHFGTKQQTITLSHAAHLDNLNKINQIAKRRLSQRLYPVSSA